MNKRVQIGNLWFTQYCCGDKTFVNYLGGRVLLWDDIDKSTIQAVGFAPTRKYRGGLN